MFERTEFLGVLAATLVDEEPHAVSVRQAEAVTEGHGTITTQLLLTRNRQ